MESRDQTHEPTPSSRLRVASRAAVPPFHVMDLLADADGPMEVMQHLLNDARAFGYGCVKLDTAPFMHAAHTLYERLGFVDCAPYEETEVSESFRPSWRLMEKRW